MRWTDYSYLFILAITIAIITNNITTHATPTAIATIIVFESSSDATVGKPTVDVEVPEEKKIPFKFDKKFAKFWFS